MLGRTARALLLAGLLLLLDAIGGGVESEREVALNDLVHGGLGGIRDLKEDEEEAAKEQESRKDKEIEMRGKMLEG